MELSVFFIFALTTFVVVITPGPAAITIATQSSGNGVWRTQAAITGVAGANVVFFILSATGISASIIASETLFAIIKWVGVAYLSYLGLSALLNVGAGLQVGQADRTPVHTLFAKGFLVEFANPKALLYFAAILPQFVDPTLPILPQFVIMGLATLVFDFAAYSAYAALGSSIARSGVKPVTVRWLNRIAGGALLFSAVRIAKSAA
ncbi:MAG: LysE family translocator [Pseudomonadota bacterium]